MNRTAPIKWFIMVDRWKRERRHATYYDCFATGATCLHAHSSCRVSSKSVVADNAALSPLRRVEEVEEVGEVEEDAMCGSRRLG